jgi:hypothetical protein
MKLEDLINIWAEENHFSILQITTVNGESYSSFGSRIEDRELFLIVVYTKKTTKKQKTEHKV